MSAGFIIVERDLNLKDCSVFTGQIQIVDTRYLHHDDKREMPFQATDGIASADIEHAFIFHDAATAWRFAMGFEPHWDESRRRYWAFRRWIVRKDGEFYPGEVVLRHEPIGPYAGSGNTREMLLRAQMVGFEQGRESRGRELEHSA